MKSRWMLLLPLLGACEVEATSSDQQAFVIETLELPVQFSLPLAEPDRFPNVIGVDHDPQVHDDAPIPNSICEDYLGRGFPYCYDEHDGSDFILQGGFDAMDAGSTLIVAAADGVVIDTEASQYDRCHLDVELGDTTCDGREKLANYVILEHAGGVQSLYWHMATDSVLVEVGQEVRCGEPLGLVGSSGNSSMPHLHFEVQLDGDRTIDPFVPDGEGPSWWVDQGSEITLPGGPCETP